MYFEIMWLEIPTRHLYRFKRVLKIVLTCLPFTGVSAFLLKAENSYFYLTGPDGGDIA